MKRLLRYRCIQDNIITKNSICPICGSRSELESSDIYWCDHCMVPLYDQSCECCGKQGRRIATDIRPVFPQERLLLELIQGEEPGTYERSSVWNCSGNYYFIDGNRSRFSVKQLKSLNVEEIRSRYFKEEKNINEGSFALRFCFV